MTTRSVPIRAADADWFRQVLGQYPTGVSVVTGIAADGAPAGLAVGSFTSVSLDPPLVAFLPATSSSSWPKIAPGKKFCVNILGADQESVCGAFASKAADKFAGLGWRPAPAGSPILDGAVAWVDCELEAVHEAGDHLIVVGRVVDLDIERPALPLLFFQGGYGRFSPHSLALRDTRFGVQLQLVDRARPLMEALAQRTGAQVGAAYCDGSELTMLASAGTPPTRTRLRWRSDSACPCSHRSVSGGWPTPPTPRCSNGCRALKQQSCVPGIGTHSPRFAGPATALG